jgi:hypothetical protein
MTQTKRQSVLIEITRAIFRKRSPARELALIGIEKRRRTVCEVARQIRQELGLPDDPRLA